MRIQSALILLIVGATSSLTACSDHVSPTGPTAKRASSTTASADGSTDDPSAGSFTSIDVPGSPATLALDINNEGVIVGRYLIGKTTHGFVRSTAGQITTIDFPGSSFTVAAGINEEGDIVGQYALPSAPTMRHGYLLKDGKFTSFDPPGSTFTNVLGINDRGDIVGRFCVLAKCRAPGLGDYRGFLLRDGEFTVLDFPGAVETNAFKINDREEIVGAYVTTLSELPFVLRDGSYTGISLPIGRPVSQDNGGINSHGDIVGVYCDFAPPCLVSPTGTHGYMLSGDDFTTIDFPSALATTAIGINARRDIVGSYSDAAGSTHGFLLQRGEAVDHNE